MLYGKIGKSEYLIMSTNIKIVPSVAVITPTIAKSTVVEAIESVALQTYPSEMITHVLVKDGPQYNLTQTIINESSKWDKERLNRLDRYINNAIIDLPFNTGGNSFYGHRIYAAIPHLLNHDYIAFLDEDNWYEPNHIETMVDKIMETDSDFVYSFRRICDKSGNYLLDDNCESLGKWPVWPVLGVPPSDYNPAFGHLIDTSSFLFERNFIQRNCHHWHSQWGGDRNFLHTVSDYFGIQYEPTGLHTLNYRLDGNPNSVTKDFFEAGNKKTLHYYGGKLPWKKQ